jgi:hypothetical protein
MFKILVVRCRILASCPSFNAYHSSEVAFAGSQSAPASLSCLTSAVIISPSYTTISKVTAANSHYLLAACRNRARYTVAVPLWCNYSWYAKARRAHASLRRATRVTSRTWLHPPPSCDTHTCTTIAPASCFSGLQWAFVTTCAASTSQAKNLFLFFSTLQTTHFTPRQ